MRPPARRGPLRVRGVGRVDWDLGQIQKWASLVITARSDRVRLPEERVFRGQITGPLWVDGNLRKCTVVPGRVVTGMARGKAMSH